MLQSVSHPATRQDLWVIEKTGGREGGYFVEIGAHDGLKHSNTQLLEHRFGWKGLLVEPHPDLYEDLCRNRPKAKNEQIAIGPQNCRNLSFVLGDSYSGLWVFMPEDWQDDHRSRGSKMIDVNTITLRRLLDNQICPQVIDYLSLDVEGAEYPILESFFNGGHSANYHFRYLTVEFRYDRRLLTKLEDLMQYEYQLDEVRGFDACFVNKRYRYT